MIRTRSDWCPEITIQRPGILSPEMIPALLLVPPFHPWFGTFLPDLWEGHVGVEVFQTCLMTTLHICELVEQELLLCVS